jgi:chromosome segregation ATPase
MAARLSHGKMNEYNKECVMARPGISRQDVFHAADVLSSQGRIPTIDLIRQQLHTGSNSTIANHLREWRALHSDSEFAGHSQGLPPEMIAVMKSLWERMVTQSHQHSGDVALAEPEHHDLHAELQKYKTNNHKWQSMFHTWQQDKARLDAEISDLHHALDTLQKNEMTFSAKEESYLAQISEKQKLIDELHQMQTQTQHHIDQFQATVHEQQVADKSQVDQLMQQLLNELQEQNEQLIIVRDKYESLLTQYQQEQADYNTLLQSHEQLEMSVENQAAELADCVKEKNELIQSVNNWQTSCRDAENKLDMMTTELIDTQSEVKDLMRQLADAKAAISAAAFRRNIEDND